MANLYERLGGQEPLYKLVETVYDLMKRDAKLGKFFKAEFDVTKLTLRTAQFLEDRWGGPAFPGAICGSPLDDTNAVSLLFQAHARVGVTNADYTLMIQLYEKTLKKMGVGNALIQQIIDDLECLRDPIVDEKRKHRDKWMKSFQISAADEAAWQKEAEAMRKKEQERKERLENFRREKKKREQQEKQAQKELQKRQEAKQGMQETTQKLPAVPDDTEGTLQTADPLANIFPVVATAGRGQPV
eukprot:CAMPEP_0197666178 /NCGR_PEP_ID=MMETSP1338-20131121/61738_1 /TAXON_ID=43686 ORGANISM="Pelagodinium beii, Strain RCC1491" /NCGR_SAMPLE_ID=MMETSP1338 /ASSEMBLY_ACC=CAM_ASM_000754 /LENGTH=242 /DNA_ID=CAMNT_0043245163 /DNA_START=53 /DNA_END=777 /DNA_ORIENTATION=-